MGVEHVYVVYDPTRPVNRFDLGFRKVSKMIELTHYEIFQALQVTVVNLADLESAASQQTVQGPT